MTKILISTKLPNPKLVSLSFGLREGLYVYDNQIYQIQINITLNFLGENPPSANERKKSTKFFVIIVQIV